MTRAVAPIPMEPTQNLHVAGTTPLLSPREIKMQVPMTVTSNRTVVEGRRAIQAVLRGEDKRFLVVVGPCSIHDVQAAVDYAGHLAQARLEFGDKLLIVMRVYFEKPRTTVGWKGLINDPDLDGSFAMERGLSMARQLLHDIASLGVPAGTEMLEPITPQYIADLVSWASIGARTIESQTHRQLASGLSMPVGYKNGTDGNLQIALDAMRAALSSHHFLGIDEDGRTCIVRSRGNPDGHLILRGGQSKPNYDPQTVGDTAQRMRDAGLTPNIVIDCSHANSGKQHDRQEIVWRSVIEQRAAGNKALIGGMIESNLHEGAQKLTADRSQLKYGVSITDACIGWEKTLDLLRHAHQTLK